MNVGKSGFWGDTRFVALELLVGGHAGREKREAVACEALPIVDVGVDLPRQLLDLAFVSDLVLRVIPGFFLIKTHEQSDSDPLADGEHEQNDQHPAFYTANGGIELLLACGGMDRIASPNQLAAELRQLIAYCDSPQPSRRQIAAKLQVLADRLGMEFPSAEALKKYLHDHPGADKSKHSVITEEHAKEEKDRAEYAFKHWDELKKKGINPGMFIASKK